MREYVYPAIFHQNDDGSYTIVYPDLPGCISEGKSIGQAMRMAESALTQWIEYLIDAKQEIPCASSHHDIIPGKDEMVNLIRANVKDNHAVKRTVSLPKWLDQEAAEAGLSLSRVLQEALRERL